MLSTQCLPHSPAEDTDEYIANFNTVEYMLADVC